MESTEEDNKQAYLSNIKNEQEKNIRNVYERSEKVLNNEAESFQNKAESLIDLWKQLSCCGVSPKIQYVIHLMDWAKLHTLNIVLSGEWKKHKELFESKLLKEVENCERELYKLNNSFSLHCKKLIKVIRDPWGNATLNQLLNAQDPVIGTEEFEFFMGESGYLVSMRLKKLCESHCEDLALNLVTAYMRCCDWAEAQNINMNLTEDQKRFMLDVYIALLYKYKKTSVILTTLKSLSLKDGLELVQRFAKKRVNISKLWRHSNRITHLAAVLFCSTAVMQPIEQSSEILMALVDVWLTLSEKDETLDGLISSIRKVVQVTVSAPHMYIFCHALNKKFGIKIKTFNIELYVQALTTDLNLLERHKNEDDRDHLQETCKRLADGLLQLADVLEEHIDVCRECVLTSFSLQPTSECLRRIEDLARKCGYEVMDTGQWKCKLHPPISSDDDLGLQCQDCGDFMGQLELEAALNTNTALSEALTADRLGVSPELCDDLAVLVCSPRYQLLSWLQKWPDLHRLCVMYLNNPERTKNLVTELKFLEIDYSMFMNVKREPEDENTNGYEKGFELDMYSDPNYGEPPKPKKKRGRKKKIQDTTEDSDFLPFATPKSDPEVLKTLRSFRRTFKRKNDSDSGSPDKVFAGDREHSAFNNFAQRYSANDISDDNIVNKVGGYNCATSCSNCNTPSVNSINSNLSDYSSMTCSQVEFRAHEDLILQVGYPYVDPSKQYQSNSDPNRYLTEGPSTSTESKVIDQLCSSEKTITSICEDSDSSDDFVGDLSLAEKSKDSFNKFKAAVKVTNQFFEEQIQTDEQHFRLNEFTNEITIQDTSDSSFDLSGEASNSCAGGMSYENLQANADSISKNATTKSNGEPSSSCTGGMSYENLQANTDSITETSKSATKNRLRVNLILNLYRRALEKGSFKPKVRSPERYITNEGKHAARVKSPLRFYSPMGTFYITDSFKLCSSKYPSSYERKESHRTPASSTSLGSAPVAVQTKLAGDDLILAKDYSMKTLQKLNTPEKQTSAVSNNSIKHEALVTPSANPNSRLKIRPPDDGIAGKPSNSNTKAAKVRLSVDAVSRKLQMKFKHKLLADSAITAAKVKTVKADELDNTVKSVQPPKEATVNSEKNLFREKFIETVFTEENGKTLKESVKGTISKKNEGICNKENSRYVTKKKIGRNEKANDAKSSDKSSPKLPKKCDVLDKSRENSDKISPKLSKKSDIISILEKPKENSDKILPRFSRKSDVLNILEKSKANSDSTSSKPCKKYTGIVSYESDFETMFRDKLKQHLAKSALKNKTKSDNVDVSVRDKVNNKMCIENCVETFKNQRNSNETDAVVFSSISDVNYKNSSQEQNSTNVDYAAKFNLKDLRVILHRLNVKFSVKKTDVKKSKNLNDLKKLPKKVNLPVRGKHKMKKGDNRTNKSNNNVQSRDHTRRTLPLQDRNLKVVINNNDIIKPNLVADYLRCESEKLKEENSKLIPRVVLQRLELDRFNYVNSILANVPGLNDTELMRPSLVNSVVQVVQVAGGRQNSTVNSNTQTSTQVSPHIQRIGQPRTDKPETTAETTPTTLKTTTTTNSKPATSQPSTLINILSQQIIKPGQSNSVRPRSGPLINILSQQIIRPANATNASALKSTPTTATSDEQSNSTPKIVAGDQQIINQIMGPVRASVPSLKLAPPSESSRIVQFICHSSDGKLIPVTSFTPNRVVKVATTQTLTSSSSPGSPNYDENYAKLIQTAPKAKNDVTENSETLPKFQQAFGKSVYQNNVDGTNSTNITNNVASNTEADKTKAQPKSSTSVNIKPIHGGVIYTRQMPAGQTINLIPQSRAQVFRIATSNSEQISLVKDTVIHNKMSALLAAALQGKKNSEETETSPESNSGQATRVALSRPALVQNTRIVKPVLQIPSNVIRNSPQANLSSTTLEQLREFDMVYKQVKERSSTVPASEVTITPENNDTAQRISVTYLNQGQKINCAPVVVVSSYNSLQPAASPALSVASQSSSSPCVTPAPTPAHVLPKVTPKSSKGKSVKSTTLHASKASPIPKPQQKPQEDEHTTQRIFDILAEYAEQLRNSPDLNNKPAPRRRSNPPTNPSQNSKRKKSSSSKKTGQCTSSLSTEADVDDPRTMGSEDSSCGVMQLSMQEDEQPSVVASTSESNDSTVTSRQQLILTDSTHNQTHNLIIADSSVGEALKMPNTAVLVPGNYIMPVSMVKGGQQIAVVSGGSKILATVPARSGPNMLLFQSFLNQTRKTTVPTVKYSTIQPITGISSQSLAGVSAQPPVILPPSSHGISTVTLGQSIAVKKLEDTDRINTELLLTISQSRENDSASEDAPQPDSSTNIVSANVETVEIEETATLSDTSSEKAFSYRKPLIATPIATPVIAQATCAKEEVTIDQGQGTQTIMTLSLNTIERNKGDSGKAEERVQSVLVTAGTSNGPMLSHSPPQYKQSDCSGTTSNQNKDDFVRNAGKRSHSESKNSQSSNMYALQGKIKKVQAGTQKLDRELQQLCLQRKQAALERELRLQKSLSEECEDLGVDEPSTSDLFPEADLLFDSNHSPSFDQNSQDVIKRPAQLQDGKDETKVTLFGDDDFLFETGEYHAAGAELEYDEDRARMLTNGQSGTSTESESPCEDNTLLQTCTSMSDVTLNSPISPDVYNTNTPPPMNKYVHKYSNRKKNERVIQVENWTAEVSSSEDTTGSTELVKSSSRSPDLCLSKPSDEELSDGSFKVVHVAISKTECGDLHCTEDTDCSLSGRGARRSVKKLCSCCNGSQDGTASRKRPASQPHNPTPHKKAFPSKKR